MRVYVYSLTTVVTFQTRVYLLGNILYKSNGRLFPECPQVHRNPGWMIVHWESTPNFGISGLNNSFYQVSPPRFERKYGNIILTLTWIASLCIYFQTSKIQPSRVWIRLCKLCKWTQKLRDKVVSNKRDCRCENTLKPVALNIACWLKVFIRGSQWGDGFYG